ncbi:MAG: ASKHA domain-containing protein [Clostridiales bacterium]|nr:ASKHA domain-containing protein [Clostridiales bacterium]MCF8023543.1 ASKHA domain-containing protein [Clostridiales bacterium]
MPRVTVINEDKVIETMGMKSLLDVLVENNIYITAPCGGKGSCGKCIVRVNDEPVYKLACQIPVNSDLKVEIINSKPTCEKILVEGAMQELEATPKLKKLFVTPGKLTNASGGLDNLIERALGKQLTFSHNVYKLLSNIYTKNFDEIALVVNENEILDVKSIETSKPVYGVAVDLGTTTVAGYLWDLHEGRRVASSSEMNQQSPYGADVISRINYALEKDEGTGILQNKAVNTVNDVIYNLCSEENIDKKDIYQVLLVGNTAMNHLFWGLSPVSLGMIPYLPITQRGIENRVKELSIDINPEGIVRFLPSIAGFVGSDTVGAVVASKLKEDKNALLVDLGTNGEIVAAGNGQMLACSTAAGPAFEGAKISQGMQAASGAISRVKYENEEFLYNTINKVLPEGICGSGLMEAVALMVKRGVVDRTGRILSPEQILELPLAKRVFKGDDGINRFTLAFPSEGKNSEGVYITQKDIREVQLAKGAVAAGIKVLLSELNIDIIDLENIYLAGAFGNYMDVESVQVLGLLPKIDKQKIIPIGNAAGAGCQMALINEEVNEEVNKIISRIKHIELAANPDFQTVFMQSMYFD